MTLPPEQVRALRKFTGLSQVDFARERGIAYRTYQRYEAEGVSDEMKAAGLLASVPGYKEEE